jgi:15-O-acetyltransferase Tri3
MLFSTTWYVRHTACRLLHVRCSNVAQKNNHGIPLPKMGIRGLESHEVHFLDFTMKQSICLLQQVKNVIGSDSSITHLGHAAMVLALLRSNPLPLRQLNTVAKPSPFYSPCWLNGRRYLLSTVERPDPSTDYIPLCLSFAPILFPDLREFPLSLEAGKEEIRSKLVQACSIASESYRKIRNRKSILPECVVLFEDIGQALRTMRYVVDITVPIRFTAY